ncbi:MAG: hypothetical protein IJ301_04365 [Clostridia bacterium]|nr:hypothetical protein [Clostridia bacterium]
MSNLRVFIKKPKQKGYEKIIEDTNLAFEKEIGQNTVINSFILDNIAIFTSVNIDGFPSLGEYNCTIGDLPFYGTLIFTGNDLLGNIINLTDEQVTLLKNKLS